VTAHSVRHQGKKVFCCLDAALQADVRFRGTAEVLKINPDNAGADGMCGNTFYATNAAINLKTSDADFEAVCNEIVDICLLLSFLNARCVTPSGTTAQSSMQFMQLGDDFIRPRAIDGFDDLATPSMAHLFSGWLTASYGPYKQRGLRLQLSHWLAHLFFIHCERRPERGRSAARPAGAGARSF
jgi:hypothetical protein